MWNKKKQRKCPVHVKNKDILENCYLTICLEQIIWHMVESLLTIPIWIWDKFFWYTSTWHRKMLQKWKRRIKHLTSEVVKWLECLKCKQEVTSSNVDKFTLEMLLFGSSRNCTDIARVLGKSRKGLEHG